MSFQASKIQDETIQSMNAMLMLNASCQGIIESNIEKVNSPWYTELMAELKNAEELVVDWRNNGFLYFKSAILDTMTNTAQAFLDSQKNLDNLYAELAANYSEALKAEIASQLQKLGAPISNIATQMDTYSTKLTGFDSKMSVIHNNIDTTIGKIQAEEANIQSEITEINQKIANLNAQIKTDKEAIVKAEAAKKKGIAETIFGVVFAPVTFGASLILTGIGVASIVEAKSKISDMQNSISDYQKSIVGDQANLSDDQKEVATLKSLLSGTGATLNDLTLISSSLQVLKVSWAALGTELTQIVDKTQKAENAQEAIVGQAWFDAACLEWQTILPQTNELGELSTQTQRIPIGQ